MRSDPAPVFFFHLGSPACYLAAERLAEVLPGPAAWVPISGPLETDVARAQIESAAAEHGLQAVRWPARWPPRTDLSMRAATYARAIGRVNAFSLAAFRQAFAAGRDLDSADTVVLAAAACEIHPAALLKGIELRSVVDALAQATTQAAELGVRSLPAITIGETVLQGETALELAGEMLAAER